MPELGDARGNGLRVKQPTAIRRKASKFARRRRADDGVHLGSLEINCGEAAPPGPALRVDGMRNRGVLSGTAVL